MTKELSATDLSHKTVRCYMEAQEVLMGVHSTLAQAEAAIALQSEAVNEAQVALANTRPKSEFAEEEEDDDAPLFPDPGDQARVLVLQAERATPSNFVEAEVALKDAISLFKEAGEGDTMQAADAMFNFGTLHQGQGRYSEAEPYLEKAVDIYERELGAGNDKTLRAMARLISAHREQGEEVSDLDEKLLHIESEKHHQRLGDLCLRAKGMLDDAFAKKLVTAEADSGAMDLLYASAQAYALLGDVDYVIDNSEQVRWRVCDSAGQCHDYAGARLLSRWVQLLKALADATVTAEATDEAAAGASQAPAAEGAAEASKADGDTEEKQPDSEKLVEAATGMGCKMVEFCRRELGEDHKETALFSCSLAALHLASGNIAEAFELLKENLPILQQELGPPASSVPHPTVAFASADYGEVNLALGRMTEAKRAFKKALEVARLHPHHFSDEFVQRVANGSTLN